MPADQIIATLLSSALLLASSRASAPRGAPWSSCPPVHLHLLASHPHLAVLASRLQRRRQSSPISVTLRQSGIPRARPPPPANLHRCGRRASPFWRLHQSDGTKIRRSHHWRCLLHAELWSSFRSNRLRWPRPLYMLCSLHIHLAVADSRRRPARG